MVCGVDINFVHAGFAEDAGLRLEPCAYLDQQGATVKSKPARSAGTYGNLSAMLAQAMEDGNLRATSSDDGA